MTYAGAAAAAFVYGAAMVFLLLLSSLFPSGRGDLIAGHLSLVAVLLPAALGTALFLLNRSVLPKAQRIAERLIDQGAAPLHSWIQKEPEVSVRLAIIAVAAASLFLELVLIRWQASLFPVFALYKNFTLLACFCGLGLGYALAHKKLLLPAALPLLAVTLAVLSALRYTGISYLQDMLFFVPVQEEKSVFTGVAASDPLIWVFFNIPVYLLLVGTFILNVLVMMPVAQFCGCLMARVDKLAGYGCNLLGSIAGVALLFVLSWLWMGPVIWFGLAALPLLWYQLPLAGTRKTSALAAIACVVIAAWPSDPMVQNIYSPYQLIQKASKPDGFMRILSAGSFYQEVYDLSLANLNRNSAALKKTVGYYELPYHTAAHLDRVAIVGAGSGNDAAAALRAGAAAVDAVEIDPAILDLGRANHPEHPYQDKRVNAVTDDARTFFRTTDQQYDAIVYSVLDSHILLSHGSNVRLDSFVYTQEGLAEAYEHLKKGGLMSVSFTLSNTLMGRKIYSMLAALPGAGHPAAVFCGDNNFHTTAFLVEKGADVKLPARFLAEHDLVEKTAVYAQKEQAAMDLPTDDWPFFYMASRMYPASYVVALVLVMALAALLVRGFLPGHRWDKTLLPFFFLGSGFMLVETKAITELGLLFGNTWHVIGITIIGVLIMAFLANLFVAGRSLKSVTLPCLLLLGAVAAGYAVASNGGLAHAGIATKLGMIMLLTSPMLFSGVVFSTLLKGTKDVPAALAYNLMGAVLGGLLEYNSMEFGFAFLYLLALGLYALAWATAGKKR